MKGKPTKIGVLLSTGTMLSTEGILDVKLEDVKFDIPFTVTGKDGTVFRINGRHIVFIKMEVIK